MSVKINSGTSAGFDQTSRISSKTVSENLYSDADPHNRTAFGYLNKTLSGKSEAAKTLQDFLTKVLKQQPIDANLRKRNVSVILEPNKPPSQMSLEDYQKAYFRALLKQAGHANLPDADLNLIMNANTKQQTNFNLETLRREDARAGVLTVTVNKYSIELADRTAQAVSQFRQYQAGEVKAAIEKGNKYAKDAVGGFVQPIVNAPVNIINGISEPLRAGERVIFGTNKLPEIPRMTIAEKSEYWQKDGRSYAATGAEIGTTILLGGAAGAKAVGTQAGRAILGIESTYNIAAGVAGKDVTQTDKNGNAREMPMLERGLRITGGVLGARQTINAEINTPNSAVNKLDDVFGKRQAEMITPQGFRIRTNQTADELNAKMSANNSKSSGATKYNATKRTDAELQADLNTTPRTGETTVEAQRRVEYAQGEIESRQVIEIYTQLGEKPTKVDMDLNDARNPRAHTTERHGNAIDAVRDPNKKTIEGRIHGDAPWTRAENFSYKWKDKATMNRTVNEYIQNNWEQIRSDLALKGRYEADFNAGKAVGEGYFNSGQGGVGARQSVYHQTSNVKITIELVPNSNPAEMYIIRAYPNGSGK